MEMDLEGQLRFDAMAMRKAMEGEVVPGTEYAENWQDKPHRVVFDACELMEMAADRIAELEDRLFTAYP